MSTYFNINEYNVILEHKDYNTPYLFSSFTNPPLCYRESSSILASRNAHTLNFNNELGYQLEINRTYDSELNILFNFSFAIHHLENDNDTPNIIDLYGHIFGLLQRKNDIKHFVEYNPYRQIYFEFSNWDKKDKFYYRFGYDFYHEYLPDKTIIAKTAPLQFVYKFDKGNSITIYLEMQDQLQNHKKYYYWYLAPSYNHFGKWSITLFSDNEKKVGDWLGLDYTLNINNSNQLSIFYGSQKGGLVCANGSCVIQPDFDQGVKLTYRSSF